MLNRLWPLTLCLCLLAGPAWPHAKHKHEHKHEHESKKGHSHAHTAPHGGSLQVLGEEFAHLELVLDAEAGRLTAYALDGEAKKGVRLAQRELRLRMRPLEPKGPVFDLTLKPVANVLTGETAGDSSQFEGASPRLKGLRRFKATLRQIRVRGLEFKAVELVHPEGNE